jgi:transposase
MEVFKKMDRYTIITLKNRGKSNRQIAKDLGINRKTVARYWNAFQKAHKAFNSGKPLTAKEIEDLTDQIVNQSYQSGSRQKRKLTPEVLRRIAEILEDEEKKTEILGKNHKQKLSCSQIHQMLLEEGVDIGLTTVTNAIRGLKEAREVFIKQDYEFGARLEYDFGEVKLVINNKVTTCYLAVFGCPASGFRWAYLYTKQDQKVFLDSHVRFFAMMGGCWKELVYDNMKNVVSRFIGRNEKELNEKLLNLALYYQFEINVTNCFSGHEKGYVESAVKKIRNAVFAKKYQFESLDEAADFLEQELIKLNRNSAIEEEKQTLTKFAVDYELAEVLIATVDKYSLIRVENNYYSVPDYLSKKKVVVKNYLNRIVIYSNNEFVCEHKKVNGEKEFKLEFSHFLKTLRRKPGALKNSLVLKQHPTLQTIYQTYFKTKPKEFIEKLLELKDEPLEQVVAKLQENRIAPALEKSSLHESVLVCSLHQIQRASQITIGG